MKTVMAPGSQVGPRSGNSTGLGRAPVVSGPPENGSKAASCSARMTLKSSLFGSIALKERFVA